MKKPVPINNLKGETIVKTQFAGEFFSNSYQGMILTMESGRRFLISNCYGEVTVSEITE